MKKLQLNKKTIASISNSSMQNVKGGASGPMGAVCELPQTSEPPRCNPHTQEYGCDCHSCWPTNPAHCVQHSADCSHGPGAPCYR